jgi:uncharacterized protein YjbJ (UPF0337 family)
MKPSTKRRLKGTLLVMKGIAKENLARATHNLSFTAEGQRYKLAGKVQKKVGRLKGV